MGRDGGHLLLFVPEAPPMPRRRQSGWQAAGKQRCLLTEQGLSHRHVPIAARVCGCLPLWLQPQRFAPPPNSNLIHAASAPSGKSELLSYRFIW